MPKKIDALDLVTAFDMPPAEAVKFLTGKGYAITFSWKDLTARAHQKAFTVAKVMQLNVLTDIHRALQTAIETGQSGDAFRKGLQPLLMAKGWWGKAPVTNPATGAVEMAQLGSPWRLNLIYRQNLQSAYMAGRRIEQQEVIKTRPYLQYIVVGDKRTTPICSTLDGRVVRADDPVAKKLYPPFHFGCRTRTVTLSQKQVDRMGLTVTPGKDLDVKPAPGFDQSPDEIPMPDLISYPTEFAKAFRDAMKGGGKRA